jgi:RNA polymerase sigma-70 factor (ECF subfamily)
MNIHLSQIETAWNEIFRAHRGGDGESARVMHEILLRYEGAIRRYLLALTRDADIADELAQDFAVRFLRGDFHRADPGLGRFRDLIKRAIHNLVIDDKRRRRTRPRAAPVETLEPIAAPETCADLDREFIDCWRSEVLEHAWKELKRRERPGGAPYYTVLRLRVDHPELRSHEIADRLATSLGRPTTPGWVRQTLSAARVKYLDLVIDEVARTLGGPTNDRLEDELRNLGLWEYCRSAWLKRSPSDS